MKVNQIYSLLNSISQQTFGNNAPTATDLTGLISMGETINSSTDRDKFFNTLVDRIGRTILRTLDLSVRFPNILMDSFEFGAVLQKITVEPMEAKQSEPWKVGDTLYTPNQFAITKATVRQSLFSGINVWSVKTTIPDAILKTAFTSENEMGALVNGIIDSMEKTMIVQISEMNRFAVNNFIAKKITLDNGVVHLATEYAALTGDTITITDIKNNKEFWRFFTNRVGDFMRYMRNPTTLFNSEGVVRETQRDNMHVFILGEAASAMDVWLQSETFHNIFTELPLYEEVDFWQSMRNATGTPDLESSSTISVKPADASSDSDLVTATGVLGALIDRMAIGTTAYNVRTSTDRNNDGEYTNYSHKCDIGYFNDMSENGVIFLLD